VSSTERVLLNELTPSGIFGAEKDEECEWPGWCCGALIEDVLLAKLLLVLLLFCLGIILVPRNSVIVDVEGKETLAVDWVLLRTFSPSGTMLS